MRQYKVNHFLGRFEGNIRAQLLLDHFHRRGAHNLPWQFIPAWATWTPKICLRRRWVHHCQWILIEWPRRPGRMGATKAVSLGKWITSGQFYAYRIGHHRTFYGLTRRDAVVREQAPSTTNEPFPQAFERFLGEKGKIPLLHIQGAGE